MQKIRVLINSINIFNTILMLEEMPIMSNFCKIIMMSKYYQNTVKICLEKPRDQGECNSEKSEDVCTHAFRNCTNEMDRSFKRVMSQWSAETRHVPSLTRGGRQRGRGQKRFWILLRPDLIWRQRWTNWGVMAKEEGKGSERKKKAASFFFMALIPC